MVRQKAAKRFTGNQEGKAVETEIVFKHSKPYQGATPEHCRLFLLGASTSI